MTVLRTRRFGVGEWYAVGAAAAFAATSILTRIAAVQADPLAGTVIRQLPLTLFSLGMMARRRKGVARVFAWRAGSVGRRSLGLLALFALVVLPLSQLWLFLAFRYGGLLVASPFFSISPLFAALIAVPLLGEIFSRRLGTGLIIAILGAALLIYGEHTGIPFSPQWPLGALYGLLTALMFGVSANLTGYLLRLGLDIYTLLGITSVSVVLVFTLLLAGSGRLSEFSAIPTTALWALLLSGMSQGLARYFFSRSLALTTVASANAIKAAEVVLGSVIAILLLGEVINLPIGLGIALIIGGVIMVQLAKGPSSARRPMQKDTVT